MMMLIRCLKVDGLLPAIIRERMDWWLFVGVLASLVLTINAQQVTTPKKLQYCLPNLDGYIFENPSTQRCYQFVTAQERRMSYADASDYCHLNDGRLVNIENAGKQRYLERALNEDANTYKPDPDTYNALVKYNKTWGDYDPDVWIGATRDSDGTTWRFDQYTTSRTVQSVVLTWFNYGTDEVMLAEQNAEKNRFTADTCMFIRFNWKKGTTPSGVNYTTVTYPWYERQMCSNPKGKKHPFICEYEGYEYRQGGLRSKWVIVIIVLASFMCCGFFACTIYCLWDKIHTSYNVLQV